MNDAKLEAKIDAGSQVADLKHSERNSLIAALLKLHVPKTDSDKMISLLKRMNDLQPFERLTKVNILQKMGLHTPEEGKQFLENLWSHQETIELEDFQKWTGWWEENLRQQKADGIINSFTFDEVWKIIVNSKPAHLGIVTREEINEIVATFENRAMTGLLRLMDAVESFGNIKTAAFKHVTEMLTDKQSEITQQDFQEAKTAWLNWMHSASLNKTPFENACSTAGFDGKDARDVTFFDLRELFRVLAKEQGQFFTIPTDKKKEHAILMNMHKVHPFDETFLSENPLTKYFLEEGAVLMFDAFQVMRTKWFEDAKSNDELRAEIDAAKEELKWEEEENEALNNEELKDRNQTLPQMFFFRKKIPSAFDHISELRRIYTIN